MSIRFRIKRDDYQGSIQHALKSNEGLKLLPNDKYNVSKQDMDKEFRECFHDCIRRDIPKDNIKLDIKFVIQTDDLHENEIFIPLNAFFYHYTVDLDYGCLKFKVVDDKSTLIFLKCESRYGPLFFMASCSTEPGNCIRILPNKYYNDNDETPRVSFQCRIGPKNDKPNLFTIARIDPYLCAHCGKHMPHMKKCRGCWDALGINVRYCNKDCQRLHFREHHKFYCGSRSEEAVKARRQEFEARSGLARKLTLLSLEDSAKA